jgi:hypothetical protein
MNDELEGFRKEEAVAYSRYRPRIGMEWLSKATKHLSQDSQCPAEIWAGYLLNTNPKLCIRVSVGSVFLTTIQSLGCNLGKAMRDWLLPDRVGFVLEEVAVKEILLRESSAVPC